MLIAAGSIIPGWSAANVEASQLFFRGDLSEIADEVGMPEHHLSKPPHNVSMTNARQDTARAALKMRCFKMLEPGHASTNEVRMPGHHLFTNQHTR